MDSNVVVFVTCLPTLKEHVGDQHGLLRAAGARQGALGQGGVCHWNRPWGLASGTCPDICAACTTVVPSIDPLASKKLPFTSGSIDQESEVTLAVWLWSCATAVQSDTGWHPAL